MTRIMERILSQSSFVFMFWIFTEYFRNTHLQIFCCLMPQNFRIPQRILSKAQSRIHVINSSIVCPILFQEYDIFFVHIKETLSIHPDLIDCDLSCEYIAESISSSFRQS